MPSFDSVRRTKALKQTNEHLQSNFKPGAVKIITLLQICWDMSSEKSNFVCPGLRNTSVVFKLRLCNL